MVAAGHPIAAKAGLAILERGGSAIDAMVATQLVLNLVEPHSSGLGGSAYLLYYDAKKKSLAAFDARETAPMAATRTLFLRPDGQPMSFAEAAIGGRAVGVPGVPRLLETAHARFGKLPWAAVLQPAIDLATNGFPISPRLSRLAFYDKSLAAEPAARAYFLDAEGRAIMPGTRVRNPAFANALKRYAVEGADLFYRGDIARDIVAAVRGHRTNPGLMALEDLEAYRVRDVEPVCAMYRAYRVCSVRPSSYGGIGVLQVLGLLERFDMARLRPGSAEAVHLVSEAERLAYADRARYGGDDRFVDVPVAGLIDRAYLASRSALIRPERSMQRAEAGTPPGTRVAYADDPTLQPMGTTHVAIVDREGNAVALTSSIEWTFGSRQLVHGFLLNNQLTDFNMAPGAAESANDLAPGKRPRSSMAPVIAFDREGRVDLVAGSAGGSYIIGYVAKALVAMIDWKLDPQAALALPNFVSRNGPTELELGTELESLAATLKAMGHDVRAVEMTSGTHAIRRSAGGWLGGADPRREGVALGH